MLTAEAISERLATLKNKPAAPTPPPPAKEPPAPQDRPSVRSLVVQLKAADQDFEFYPTTDKMIQKVLDHITSDAFFEAHGKHRSRYDIKSVLDVGAGAGAFLKAAGEHERYRGAELLAIEKSQILISQLVGFCKVIGTDFHAQSFLPKQVDVLFSNPPYLEYEQWTTRLIKECPAEMMYFIIPSRWKDSVNINAAIKFRNADVTVIGSDDFLDADHPAPRPRSTSSSCCRSTSATGTRMTMMTPRTWIACFPGFSWRSSDTSRTR